SSDFPTVSPIELTRGGGAVGRSGFVSKPSPDGAQRLYSTYLGGSGSAVINGLALDAGGNVYVTGETSSVDFPTTPGVIQEKAGKRHCIEGCTDAFVSKIAPSGSALVYSTYLYGELDVRPLLRLARRSATPVRRSAVPIPSLPGPKHVVPRRATLTRRRTNNTPAAESVRRRR